MKAEEKAERQGYLGASDFAAILGIDRFRKPIDVWMEKTGQKEARDDDDENAPASWGRFLERVLMERWQHESGLPLTRSGRAPRRRTFVHPVHPFIRATPDGYYLPRSAKVPEYVIEAKTSRIGRDFGEPLTDEIPRYYKVQTIVQAAVTGSRIIHVPVLIAGSDFRRYIVTPTEEQIERVIAAGVEFWNDYVLTGKEPEELSEEYVRQKFPEDTGEDLVATDADVKLVESYRIARQNREQTEAAEAAAKVKIENRIGDHSRFLGPGFVISYKRSKDSQTTDWKSLVADLERALVSAIGDDDGSVEIPVPKTDERVSPEQAIEIIRAAHTETRPGTRRFVPQFFEEE